MMLAAALLMLLASPGTVSEETAWKLLRKRVKYVFVLCQESRGFDRYFGTFPGAEGLYSHSPGETPGFFQTMIGLDGRPFTIRPFRIGPSQNSADTADLDHSHLGIVSKMDVRQGRAGMDRFALEEERSHMRNGRATRSAIQFGELAMSYVDGDTIPFLWQWADRFTLCDHIFQTVTGPSVPGDLSVIAAQTGVSQWLQHPEQTPLPGRASAGVPVVNDVNPLWGSSHDTTERGRMPRNRWDNPTLESQVNLTFPSLPLTLAGGSIGAIVRSDRDPAGDLDDIVGDVGFLTHQRKRTVPWGWYQEGFDREPLGAKTDNRHASYITSHNGPQFFGYVANNPKMSANLHGLHDFFIDIARRRLPSEGVFYVKGGYRNEMGLLPASPDPAVKRDFAGDDDHPGYSDAQISEAHLARVVNAIADSPYWNQSVIIIAWSDSGGEYDHVPPPIRTIGHDRLTLCEGPRVPMIVLSPFARRHAVFHGFGDQSSVVKFVDRLFGLTPLADLPVERQLRRLGKSRGIDDAGPRDDLTSNVSNLLGAFDIGRLLGTKKPIPAADAQIPPRLLYVLPSRSGYGLRQLGIVPTDKAKHVKNMIPAGFTALPREGDY